MTQSNFPQTNSAEFEALVHEAMEGSAVYRALNADVLAVEDKIEKWKAEQDRDIEGLKPLQMEVNYLSKMIVRLRTTLDQQAAKIRATPCPHTKQLQRAKSRRTRQVNLLADRVASRMASRTRAATLQLSTTAKILNRFSQPHPENETTDQRSEDGHLQDHNVDGEGDAPVLDQGEGQTEG